MEFKKAEEYILKRLEKDLDKRLYYHNVQHTMDVYGAARFYLEKEKVDEEDAMLVLTASLYHDSGFLFRYVNNEIMAAKLVQEILPGFQYTDQQIDQICDMIQSTRMPQEPLTFEEKILCDADLDYMGRDDFFMEAMRLFQEMNEFGFRMTLMEWYELQLKFVERHRFFSHTAIALRREKKIENLAQIKELMRIK